MTSARLRLAASISLILLIALCLGWELWWAPLHPGGSRLALKAALLLLPLPGILRGKRYTYQWSSLFILLYMMEGAVRATSEHGLVQTLALLELVLATGFFVCIVLYARLTRPSLQKKAAEH
jgi:uncharacterized membrane protein